jgi:hypothetical protein
VQRQLTAWTGGLTPRRSPLLRLPLTGRLVWLLSPALQSKFKNTTGKQHRSGGVVCAPGRTGPGEGAEQGKGDAVIRHSARQRLTCNRAALALLLVLCAPAALLAQVPRLTVNRADNVSQAISVSAKDMNTWVEKDRLVVLLKGAAFINQGLVQARMQNAVLWIDTAAKSKTGAYQIDVYAEDGVYVADGANVLTGDQTIANALFDLATRGEVRFNAYGSKVEKEARNDEVFRRGSAARSGPPPSAVKPAGGAVAPGPVVQAVAQVVQSPPPPPPTVTPLPAVQPPAVTPLPAAAPPPAGGGQNVPGVPVQQLPSLVRPPAPPGSQSQSPLQPPPSVPVNPQSPGQVLPQGPPPRVVPLEETMPGMGQQVIIQPRSSLPIKGRNYAQPNGETVVVVTGGIMVTAINPAANTKVDLEADRLVFWTRGDPAQAMNSLRGANGERGKPPEEFYLSGNVELRSVHDKETRLIRCEEVYYNTARNVAIATNFDMEMARTGLPDPAHFKGPLLEQLNANLFKFGHTDINASKLPYDPGLQISFTDSTVEMVKVTRRSIFGFAFTDPKTGLPEQETQRIFAGRNFVLSLGGVPVFYLPYLAGNVNDPLGPLDNLGINYNRIFGFQAFTTWDMFELLGLHRQPGERWRLDVDYMSARGPALGTDYLLTQKDLFGFPNKSTAFVKAYGIQDKGTDILGGGRGAQQFINFNPPTIWETPHGDYRGRLLGYLNMQDMLYGFSMQIQGAALSDRNVLEQYFLQEFQRDLNQETFLYAKQQNGIWAWSVLAEPHDRGWVTETQWLPKFEGHLIGQKFFDLFTYNIRTSAGYAHLFPTTDATGPLLPTDANTATGRFDFWQELALPFQLGAFKLVPYGIVDLTYYTQDLAGNDIGRFYGAGGLRGSIPFSRLYPEVESDLLNLNGIFHKIVLSGNYYAAHSSVSLNQLPQLDRLHDDASDQAVRDIRAYDPLFYPGIGNVLAKSPLYDPQLMALRRLVTDRVDTLDTVEVLQADIRQRWQTKRGFPGQQHIVDWMTLDLSASFFPHSQRDNFGNNLAFLEYDWNWNLGDRTSLFSTGWFDPETNGPRVFTFGGQINRPDKTNLMLSYRQIDPLHSRAVIASITYPFSMKYSITASTSYDLGTKVQASTIFITRTGTDLTASLGFSYNSTLNTVSLMFTIVPNLAPNGKMMPGSAGMFGSPGTGGLSGIR